jgi:hypothetical protein
MPVLPVTRMRSGGYVVAAEILRGAFGGREMQRAQTGGEDAIELFREWLAHVAGAQAGFHVAYGNARIERGQGAAKSGGGVALHQDDVGPFGGEHALERRQNARRRLRQRLSRLHQVEIVVGRDAEDLQYLIEHLAMLRGDAAFHLEFGRTGAQMEQHRAELDGFRPRAEDQKYLGHHCYSNSRREVSRAAKSGSPYSS